MIELRAEPCHPEVGQRSRPLNLVFLRRESGGHRLRQPLEAAPRQATERALGRLEYRRLVDRPDDDQGERLRDVVAPIEGEQRVPRELLDDLRRAEQ